MHTERVIVAANTRKFELSTTAEVFSIHDLMHVVAIGNVLHRQQSHG
jgi:hypothetical protein